MQKKNLLGYLLIAAVLVYFPAARVLAQRNRVTGPIDNSRRVRLHGHLHPKADPQSDQGEVDASLKLPYVTLVLKPSASQQADLDRFLAQLQDPSSPDYHHWLTPEQYADRFGTSQDDIDKLVAWLQSQNFAVASVARGRNAVSFSGSAADVERAFGTRIHRYQVNGKRHFANAVEPSIPAAFQNIVTGIHGLTDFRMHPPKRRAVSNYTSGRGNHYLGPEDIATVYNVKPLYDAGIDGTGQRIAVAGQSAVDVSDIEYYRSFFNLPAHDPTMTLVPGSRDPGTVSGDVDEASLDLELAGAVARNASIVYVYATDVMNAVQYAIDQNVAPVLSVSYGACEAETSPSDALTMQTWARQANAQGITWFAASGDAGGADCYGGGGFRQSAGLSVDLPAGIPEVTGVGGTEFDEGSGSYWNDTNDASRSSVLSYIPEKVWNDSLADGSPSASGGGASAVFAKPSWQTGNGVPDDGARDVPDISLAGSADHDGYYIYTGGQAVVMGGTSTGAPSFAGMASLLNQYLMANGIQSSPGLGNINPRLYSLAQAVPNAFHDVINGDNMVSPCSRRTRFCPSSPVGYSAGAGYDPATGLGSVDLYNLATSWHDTNAATARGTAGMTVAFDGRIVTAALRSGNGGTPTGTVAFYYGDILLGYAALSGAGGTATATLDVSGVNFPPGSGTFKAEYGGDGMYNGAMAAVTLTIAPPAGS